MVGNAVFSNDQTFKTQIYDRQELNESIKKMNYARMFAAQSTLTDFSKKF
jgi:hypothetical protein